ncbi:MAG: hypothetical protein AB7F43_06890 [Bacteriovoracia bacterium]
MQNKTQFGLWTTGIIYLFFSFFGQVFAHEKPPCLDFFKKESNYVELYEKAKAADDELLGAYALLSQIDPKDLSFLARRPFNALIGELKRRVDQRDSYLAFSKGTAKNLFFHWLWSAGPFLIRAARDVTYKRLLAYKLSKELPKLVDSFSIQKDEFLQKVLEGLSYKGISKHLVRKYRGNFILPLLMSVYLPGLGSAYNVPLHPAQAIQREVLPNYHESLYYADVRKTLGLESLEGKKVLVLFDVNQLKESEGVSQFLSLLKTYLPSIYPRLDSFFDKFPPSEYYAQQKLRQEVGDENITFLGFSTPDEFLEKTNVLENYDVVFVSLHGSPEGNFFAGGYSVRDAILKNKKQIRFKNGAVFILTSCNSGEDRISVKNDGFVTLSRKLASGNNIKVVGAVNVVNFNPALSNPDVSIVERTIENGFAGFLATVYHGLENSVETYYSKVMEDEKDSLDRMYGQQLGFRVYDSKTDTAQLYRLRD